MIYQVILTEKCNLNCEYCFESNKGNRSMNETMIPDLLEFIKKYKEEKFILDNRNITINFNGGEALLEFELLKKMFTAFKTAGIDRFTVSTNLTLANAEQLAFFYENNINLHVSIDGKVETHNRYRKYTNGSGSFNDVYKNIQWIRNKYPAWQISHSMVFTPETVGQLYTNVKFLVDLGIRNITACFCSDYRWDLQAHAEFGKQIPLLSQLYKSLYDNQDRIYFSLLNSAITNSINNNKPDCGVCKDQIAILPGGELLPCAVFIGLDNYKDYIVGSIYGQLDYEKIGHFAGQNNLDLSECEACVLLPRCHNKCYGANERIEGNLFKIPDSYCGINQQCLMEADKLIDYFYKTKNKLFMEEYIEPLKKRHAAAVS